MSRRKKKKRFGEGVELNLAAMLDMAFQLLTFFILTFRPSPIEGEIGVHMAPERAVSSIAATSAAGSSGNAAESQFFTPQITIRAHAGGGLGSVALGVNVVFNGSATPANLAALERALADELKLGGETVDQVQILVDPKVNYEDLMKVMDACMKQKLADGTPLTKVSFVELTQ